MRRSYLLGLLLACFSVQGQVIDSFPYVQDFEDFTTIQNDGSCLSPAGLSIGGWTQPTSDDGDWRADTAGTATLATGPGATYSTSGSGSGTDASPGTTGGIYLYIEATSCVRGEYSILSPIFDLSNADTFYQLSFAYHMYGEDVHSLHLDIYADGQWHMDQWVRYRQQDSSWLYAYIPLVNYKDDSVQLRFTAISGMGDASDICLDDVRISPMSRTTYDGAISHLGMPYPYEQVPLLWDDGIEMDVEVFNQGTDDLSGVWVEFGTGSVSDTLDYDSLYANSVEGLSGQLIYSSIGVKAVEAVVHSDQTDGNSSNDTLRTLFLISDSTLATDDGNADFNLGYNGATGYQGKVIHVEQGDTVTSISIHCIGTSGDSAQAYILSYSGTPGTQIAQTEYITFDGTEGWKTLNLECEVYLPPGDYFLSVLQATTNRISLGSSFGGYKPNNSFYSGNGLAWNTVESLDFFGNYMIRLNYGSVVYPEVQIFAGADTICAGQGVTLRAQGADTYRWFPATSVKNPTAEFTFTDVDESGWIYLEGRTDCGYTDRDSIYIYVNPTPSATITQDTTICVGDVIALRCQTNNSYRWIGGPSNSNYNVTAQRDTFYQVKVDSSNGCSKIYLVHVDISQAYVQIEADTAVCQYQEVQFSASGADLYVWPDGTHGTTYTVEADQSTYVVVEGYDSLGCVALDSAYLEVYQVDEFIHTPDTGACFGDSLYLTASGGDSIQWVGGPVGGVYPLKVRKASSYVVQVFNANGCNDQDTIDVAMYIPPFLQLSNDTTVCEGQEVDFHASGGDTYEWSTGESTSSITVEARETRYYGVTIYGAGGCSDEDSVLLTVDPLPVAGFQIDLQRDTVAKFTSNAQNGDSHHWDFGDGDNSTDEHPEHIYDSSATYTITYTVTNACGSDQTSDTLTITIPQTGSVDDRFMRAVQIYPVPTKGDLQIALRLPEQGAVEIQLMDAAGAVVLQQLEWKTGYTGTYHLDLEELPAGMYFLQVRMGSRQGAWKVMKR